MSRETSSKPIGHRIYADTVAAYDTTKYRNRLCEKWLMKNGSEKAEYQPYTPSSMLTTKSHAQMKLVARRNEPKSEPIHVSLDQINRASRASGRQKNAEDPPMDIFGDVIDAPVEFKHPLDPPKRKQKRPSAPCKPGDDFGLVDLFQDFASPPPIASVATHQVNRKRKCTDSFDGDAKKTTSGGGPPKMVYTFGEFEPNHHEPAAFGFETMVKRPTATRTSNAMTLYNPREQYQDLDAEFFADVAHGSRVPHQPGGHFRELHRNQDLFRTVNTGHVLLSNRARSQYEIPVIFNIQCEKLVIANDRESK